MSDYGLKSTESGELLALRGITVSARVTGLLAATTLVQKYKNDTETNLELAYIFPLPVSGILLSFSVNIGERKFKGQVIPRSQAEAVYEKTIGEGNSAFRLQEIRSGMYSATLGNVMPGEEVAITLTYAEPMSWNGKSIRYRLPTTIAPRYGEPTGMQPWQRPKSSLLPEYPLDVTVFVTGDLARSAISCPSHKVSMKLSESELAIHLAKGATMDRDFILEIENDNVQSLGTIATALETNVAMLTLLPPEIEHQGNQRDVVLVIDCSGSMQGDSIMLAKEGLLLSLGSLAPNERFGIVAFGTRFLQFEKELQPANRKNLDMARRWINFLENLGGTDINGALNLALSLKQEHPMDILLLTDGQDWQVGESVKKAKATGVRIFSMGIGSAVAEEAVRMMSDDTGGACELVAPTEDMSERVFRHFNRMRQPQMSRLEISWPCEPIWESRPERACFAGDAYTVFAALPVAEGKTAAVWFEFAEHEPQKIEVSLLDEASNADAIIRLGAKQRLPHLEETKQQAWAVKHQLITKNTDYLITVERGEGEKAEDLPELQNQPQMLPAGWGGTSSVIVKACVERAVLYSPARGSHDSIAFSAAPAVDYSHLDVPAVCRKRSVTVEALANMSSNGYSKFIEKLNASTGKLFRRIPSNLEQLLKLPLPESLNDLIAEIKSEGVHPEAVIHSFYSALLQHSGSGLLSKDFVAKVSAFLKDEYVDNDLVERLSDVLNDLWDNRTQGVDRYDIPAFLRKQAD